MKKILVSIFFLIFIPCCSSKNDKDLANINLDDKKIFLEAIKYSKEKKYEEASKKFKQINEELPYSDFSSKAQIYDAYVNFEANKIKKTILLLNDYLNMNPSGEFSIYAHYMIAMCYYVQIADPDRDSEFTKLALEKFSFIVNNFPNSKFGKDSKFKIDYLKNSIAIKEFNIGMFYLKKNAPTPAIKRFSNILKDFQGTSIIPQTLFRISESFMILGLNKEAYKSMEILKYNFPNNQWSKQLIKIKEKNLDENNKKGFFSRIFK